MSTKLSECKVFVRGIVYVPECKNVPSAVVQYNDLAEKGLLALTQPRMQFKYTFAAFLRVSPSYFHSLRMLDTITKSSEVLPIFPPGFNELPHPKQTFSMITRVFHTHVFYTRYPLPCIRYPRFLDNL